MRFITAVPRDMYKVDCGKCETLFGTNRTGTSHRSAYERTKLYLPIVVDVGLYLASVSTTSAYHGVFNYVTQDDQSMVNCKT